MGHTGFEAEEATPVELLAQATPARPAAAATNPPPPDPASPPPFSAASSFGSPAAPGLGEDYELLDVETVQRILGRSRASIYRYAHTDPKGEVLNLPFDPHHLNPEHRRDFQEPLLFHANEVARFARDVLRIQDVTIKVMTSPQSQTQRLLTEILAELKEIRSLLSEQSPRA